ncbi:MAG: asparagine synthase (glutamine-hydrolyzing) [Candidatus Cloacimonetes bacterium]|nr:asparagine synthase (glutamine-hydrolyzing) [Candidatus Cloacimonadota bacterium]
MSGISGIISKNKTALEAISLLVEKINHRGPDNEYYFHNDFMSLGFNQLKLTDCIFKKEKALIFLKRYVVMIDGNIYNLDEIKRQLMLEGYEFSEDNHFEVIAAAYDKYGSNCLNMFNGIWALFIYDMKSGKIFLSRDRLGVKPLFFYQTSELFIFSSEIKAILKHPFVEKKIDEDWCVEYLRKGLFFLNNCSDFDYSPYSNIREFKENSYYECRIDSIFNTTLQTNTFYEFKVNKDIEKFNQKKFSAYSEQFRYLLDDSVKIRIPKDENVLVGNALGGIDSSILAYLTAKNTANKNRHLTFSSVYKSSETNYCDESYYIDLTAKHLNINSKQIEPQTESILSEHKKVVQMMDIPTSSSCLSAWHSYKLAAESAGDKRIVSLDGQGADELLAGYLHYLIYYLYPMNPVEAAKQCIKYLNHDGAGKIITKAFLLKMLKMTQNKPSLIRNLLKLPTNISSVNEICLHDIVGNLKLLYYYGDKESIAFSVESRLPYIDYRLIDFVLSIPSIYKFHEGWPKYLSRKSFEDKLPGEVVWRKTKHGWSIPDKFWFDSAYKHKVTEKITKSDFTQRVLSKTDNILGQNSHHFLIRLYNLSLWHELC